MRITIVAGTDLFGGTVAHPLQIVRVTVLDDRAPRPAPSGALDGAPSGAPVTVNDVVASMARALDVTLSVKHEGTTDEYIRFRSVDTAMRERFGFAPSIPFDDGLKRLAAFFAEQRA